MSSRGEMLVESEVSEFLRLEAHKDINIFDRAREFSEKAVFHFHEIYGINDVRVIYENLNFEIDSNRIIASGKVQSSDMDKAQSGSVYLVSSSLIAIWELTSLIGLKTQGYRSIKNVSIVTIEEID
ncbi:hypothetical protein OXIME_001139 [Oxyplasma meridianum]|uniref:Uncharacterized protein n=1 Tax=Oxyplasma meridianum TaxID=3073602 RepID=A0AAX4NII1_9ARCH